MMPIQIINAEQDQNGNSKENIFIALQDGQYRGHAYAWAYENRQMSLPQPWNVYFEVNPQPSEDAAVLEEVRDRLYDAVFARAMQLRAQRSGEDARVYTSAKTEEDQAYFIRKGLQAGDGIIEMELPLPAGYSAALPDGMALERCEPDNIEALEAYREAHGATFVTPIDKDEFAQQRQMPHFAIYRLMEGERTLAWARVFQREEAGHLETLIIDENSRGRGLGRRMLALLAAEMHGWGCRRATLEVWLRNLRAVALYESFGYRRTETHLYFPGIDLPASID